MIEINKIEGMLSSILLGIGVGMVTGSLNLNTWGLVGGLFIVCGIVTIKHEIFWRIARFKR